MAYRTPTASRAHSLTLTDHRALVFDVYGTLVDWESAIHDAIAPTFPTSSREQILVDYAEVEANLQTQFQSTPYAQILELAYRQLTTTTLAKSGVEEGRLRQEQPAPKANSPEDDDAKRFGRSVPHWKPFPDTIDALHRLKKYFALVVLSNVDDVSFAGTHATLCTHTYPGSAYPTITPSSPFSLVLTAQQVGAYKPDPRMLASALRQLSAHPDPSLPSHPHVRVDPSAVLVVANSTRHDIIPAMQHGLRNVWISRHGANVIGNEGCVVPHDPDAVREGAALQGKHPYNWRYDTLSRMADVVEEEVRSKEAQIEVM